MYIHIHVFIYVYVCIYIYTHIHAYQVPMHAPHNRHESHIHIHTHTYIHTQTTTHHRYLGTHLTTVPVVSSFAKHESYVFAGDHSSASAIPDAFNDLPKKLRVTPEMTAVDTASMPHATAVVYNNFPREPTGV